MKLLEKHFEIALETPDGITRLRELILKLAMQGKLVEQNSNDKPAQKLLKEIEKEKERLLKSKLMKKQSSLEAIKKEQIPYLIPNNWKWIKLENICTLITDGAHHTPNYIDEGVPFLSVKNLSSGKIDFNDTKYISKKEHLELTKRCNPEYNDILLTKIGTTGIAVTIDTDKEFSIFVSVALLKIIRDKVHPKFIENLINSPLVRKYSKDGTEGVGNKNLVLRKIREYIIPLPPLEEQKRIVEKIDQLMLLCDKLEAERNSQNKLQLQMNSAAINNLIKANDETSFNNAWSFIANQFNTLYTVKQNVTDLKNLIFELASRGKIVNQNINDISVEEQIKIYGDNIYDDEKSIKIKLRIKEATIHINEIPYEVPNSWKWLRLLDIAKYNGRPNVKPTEIFDDIWVLDLEDIEKDTSRILNKISNLERQSKSTKSSFKQGDVLYGKLRPYLNKVIIADEDGVCTTEIVPIVPSKLILSEYLIILLKRSTFLNHVNSLSYGVKMPRLGTNDAEMSIHPIPPLAEQKRIVEKVNQLFELCDKLEKNIEQSSQKQSQILNAVLAQV